MGADSARIFKGVRVYFVEESINLATRRIGIWAGKLRQKGGEVVEDPSAKHITHVLVGDKKISPAPQLPKATYWVSVEWLEACLAEQRLLPAHAFQRPLPSLQESSSHDDLASAGPMRRYEAWLGFWEPHFDHITNLTEFVLQATFSISSSTNEPLVALLMDLCKYETAISEERHLDDGSEVEAINHKALQYARAAAIARACSFKIGSSLGEHELPFVGPSSARVIRDLVQTGSCRELESFRNGDAVLDSKGNARPETLGAKERRLFKKLPGVGVRSAKAWWDAGFRSYEDLEAYLAEGGDAAETKNLISRNQIFSLHHRNDLLEDCPAADIREMQSTIQETLMEITGSEWNVWLVGGARRSTASHDADFVASNPSSVEHVVLGLVDNLTSKGRMVTPSEGMCLVQHGRMEHHMDKLKRSIAAPKHNLQADRFDRVVGIFITQAGSKQYNRFLRQHAINRGLNLNAHRLMREDKGLLWLIPQERSPLDRDKKEFWPPGWDARRSIEQETDVFELLEVPYREPWERNCP